MMTEGKTDDVLDIFKVEFYSYSTLSYFVKTNFNHINTIN